MAKNTEGSLVIKKKYVKPTSIKTVKIPVGINSLLKNAKKEGFNIHVTRILISILAKVKLNQNFSENQLKLFSDDFFMSANSVTYFEFKYSEFLPKGNKNIQPIKDALSYLEEYKSKEWHKVTNKYGHEFEIKGGLIMNIALNKTKGGISFMMNAYWYNQFLNISKGYNSALNDLFMSINSLNSMMFYVWLINLKPNGTVIKLETLNKRFGLNYKKISEASRSFLDPIKKELDTKSDLSFNFSKNEKGSINVVPYNLDEKKEDIKQKDKSFFDKKSRDKVRYLKKKHGLNNDEWFILKGLYQRYGYIKMNKLISNHKNILNSKLKGNQFMSNLSSIYINLPDFS